MDKSSEIKAPSQAEIIKAHLEAGNTITTLEACQLWDFVCLPQRIRDLRLKGYVIESKVAVYNGKRFNVYYWGEQDRTAHDIATTPAPLEVEDDITATASAPVASEGVK